MDIPAITLIATSQGEDLKEDENNKYQRQQEK